MKTEYYSEKAKESDNFVSSLIPKVMSLRSNLCSSDLCLLHWLELLKWNKTKHL